jgi:hypothetical protein
MISVYNFQRLIPIFTVESYDVFSRALQPVPFYEEGRTRGNSVGREGFDGPP